MTRSRIGAWPGELNQKEPFQTGFVLFSLALGVCLVFFFFVFFGGFFAVMHFLYKSIQPLKAVPSNNSCTYQNGQVYWPPPIVFPKISSVTRLESK